MVETDQQCAEEEIVEFSNIHLRIKMDLEDIKRSRYSWNTANVDVKHQSIINHFSTIEMMWNQRALSFSVLFIISYVIFNIYLLAFCRFYILSVLCHTHKKKAEWAAH
jgi:hypothetical protein